MKRHLMKIKGFSLAALVMLLGFAPSTLAVSNPAPPGGVPIESSLAVANVTSGDNRYHDSVNAKVDEVVKFEVWYHNPEPSGTDRIARNVNVKIQVPQGYKKTHTATSSVGGSNTNTESDIATVNTQIDTFLEYIPGTAYRRYNAGTAANQNWVTVKIPDTVTTTGYVIPSLKPCWEFQETITAQYRVKAAVFSLEKKVKKEGDSEWKTDINVEPGDKLAYLIIFKNVSNVRLNNVIVQDSFPPKLEFVKGSAKLFTTTYPNGTAISDNLIVGGANLGNFAPGANGQVRFSAIVPKELPAGCYTFRNVVRAKADEAGWVNNEALLKACYKEAPKPPVTPPEKPPVTPEKPKQPTVSSLPAPTALPVSGPLDALGAGIGLMSLSGGTAAWLRSKKRLKNAQINR